MVHLVSRAMVMQTIWQLKGTDTGALSNNSQPTTHSSSTYALHNNERTHARVHCTHVQSVYAVCASCQHRRGRHMGPHQEHVRPLAPLHIICTYPPSATTTKLTWLLGAPPLGLTDRTTVTQRRGAQIILIAIKTSRSMAGEVHLTQPHSQLLQCCCKLING